MEQHHMKLAGKPFVSLAVIGCLLLSGGILAAATGTFRSQRPETSSQENQATTDLKPTMQTPDEQKTSSLEEKIVPETADKMQPSADTQKVQGIDSENVDQFGNGNRLDSNGRKSRWAELFNTFMSRIEQSRSQDTQKNSSSSPDSKNR